MSRKSECARHCFGVWRRGRCSSAAAGSHSSSNDCAACSLQLGRAGRRQPMPCGGSGALKDCLGRGHLVFGRHSHATYMGACSFPFGQRGPCGSVATITAYLAQIPGVSDRVTRQHDISHVSAMCFISSLPGSQDFAAVLMV